MEPPNSIISVASIKSVQIKRIVSSLITVNDVECPVPGECIVELKVDNHVAEVCCLVVSRLPLADVLIGMDLIKLFGGFTITDTADVTFLGIKPASSYPVVNHCALTATVQAEPVIKDEDFVAYFENCRWKDRPPSFRRLPDQYRVKKEHQQAFDEEVQTWIENGWLQPYNGEVKGSLPLMAVIQENKAKVRPVLDYRDLNQAVSSHTAESDVCAERLRVWRRKSENASVIDLKKAYLQLHVDESLWPYQVVNYRGQKMCLTRLGFGLSVAPKIMTKVLKWV